ncbi:hypothetical protein GGTG_06674 [Gaeumannomyces tritici R3-111a-1]|uniref:Clr5 domain-containing protein n=1 Tax=Gaeumannomyces tritici (strain R3-111a-1) TaxID=644352 RepID=J3NZH6_GAET3|nr:hypothetical protein GGTG_06674 [Gaeumannomyces tritici R3-111a-1]EJT76759.1 hypothetical protein GGTG_06674 [Gaeumannomyces tritici R3-111a-1]
MPDFDSQVIQRTEGPTSAMWEQYKPIIRDLYIKQNRPLKEIIYIMKVTHGLIASVKMYKYRLKAWGIRKNSRSTAAKLEQHRKDGTLVMSTSQPTETVTRTPSPAVYATDGGVLEMSLTHAIPLQSTRHTEQVLRMLNRYYGNLHDPSAVIAPFWSPEERRQNMKMRGRSILGITYATVPGSTETMKLTRLMFDQIPLLAKQRERWAIPHGLHSMDRLARIPGASQVARLTLNLTRDAAWGKIGPWHPFAVIWTLLRNHQDQCGEEMSAAAAARSATDSGSSNSGWVPSHSGAGAGTVVAPGFDPWTLEVFARCVDDHMRAHHGILDPIYLETHLRMRKNDCTPDEYAAEVHSLLAQGARRDDVSSILESVFAEELFKESMFIELRSFFQLEAEEQQRGRPQYQRHHGLATISVLPSAAPSPLPPPPVSYLPPTPPSTSPPGNHNHHHRYAVGGVPFRERRSATPPPPLGQSYVTTSNPAYPRVVDLTADCDSEQDGAGLQMQPQLDLIDTLIGLIGRLQLGARAGGLSLNELADIKAEGAWMLHTSEPPLPMSVADVAPVYYAMTPPCS